MSDDTYIPLLDRIEAMEKKEQKLGQIPRKDRMIYTLSLGTWNRHNEITNIFVDFINPITIIGGIGTIYGIYNINPAVIFASGIITAICLFLTYTQIEYKENFLKK